DRALLSDQTIIVVPKGLGSSGLEREFLGAIPKSRRVDIVHPLCGPDNEKSDIALLAQIGKKGMPDSPSPKKDQSVRFFRAIGEINEIREVLRRCLAESKRFDDVEILHTDTEIYVPLIYATARRYSFDNVHLNGIPVTYGDGLPATLSRPGCALIAWL